MLINMNCMVNTMIPFIVPIVSIIHNSHSVLSFPSQFISCSLFSDPLVS